MVEQAGSSARVGGHKGGGATRGFLFSDLRDYTAYLDEHGAEAAAELLARYRALVRDAVAQHQGAEIRTEGDSFYVVFDSVSSALLCGLAIVESAEAVSREGTEAPIRVGVGVHAGETVETAEGYVGQPVNIAARLCAIAAAGEVLVSETVRTLTATVLPVSFRPRGRRPLKGISEPVLVFAAFSGALPGRRRAVRTARRRGAWLAAALAAALLLLVAVVWLGQRPPPLAPGTWKVGLSLPLTGFLAEEVEPVRQAVALAVMEANASGALGDSRIVIEPLDGAGEPFGEDRDRSAANASALVADQAVIAMVGPWSSDTAMGQIPITNHAGLLHCSPTNTDPGLTKPAAGAGRLRSAQPTRINYIRLPAAADIEAAAAASFAFNDLGATTALVIDDTDEVGHLVAEAFEDEFAALGGSAVRRALNPDADPREVLGPLAASDAERPTLVFFGGFFSARAAEVRQAMVAAGHGAVPFMAWDAMWDGSGADEGSFIQLAGPAAQGAYVSRPSVGTVTNAFESRFRAAYGYVPDARTYEYSAAGYACVEIISQALADILAGPAPAEGLREALRASVADPRRGFETVVGTISFDANGDSQRQVVTFYRVDLAAAGGLGDWVVVKQQDFGPAR